MSLIISIEGTYCIWIYHLTTCSKSHDGFNLKLITICEYSIAFQDEKVQIEQNGKELEQVCAHCFVVPRYPLFFKYGPLTCLRCVREYQKHRFIFEKMLFCQICKKFCHLNETYTYQMEQNKCPNYITMRMLKRVKFICCYAWYKKSDKLKIFTIM